MKSIYDITVKDAELNEVNLGSYKGKTLLIVNVASYCGLTYQYEGLQNLYDNFKGDNFEILAFPCNQFKAQEPGSNDEIKLFCTEKYNITFPLFNKIDVNGPNEDPLYTFLKDSKRGFLGYRPIEWNFSKFLINSDGKVVKRFLPSTKPSKIEKKINNLLS